MKLSHSLRIILGPLLIAGGVYSQSVTGVPSSNGMATAPGTFAVSGPTEIAANNGSYNAFPWSPVYTYTGKIAEVVRVSSDHATSAAALKLYLSSDGGQTWALKSTVISTAIIGGTITPNTGGMVTLPNGNLMVTYFTEDYNNPAVSLNAYTIESADVEGSTWGTPVLVAATTANVSAPVVVLSSSMILPVFLDNGTERVYSCTLAAGTCNGTWTLLSTVVINSGDSESYISRRTSDGLLYMTIRQAKPMIAISTSTDNGATWTAPVDSFAGVSVAPTLWDRQGNLVTAYRSAADISQAGIRISKDSGVTWSSEILTQFGGSGWFLYGALMNLNNGLIGFSYSLQRSSSLADVYFSYLNDPNSFSPELPQVVAGLTNTGNSTQNSYTGDQQLQQPGTSTYNANGLSSSWVNTVINYYNNVLHRWGFGQAGVTTTATGAAGSLTIVVASASGVSAAQSVGGAGILPNTTVISVSGTTVTLSRPTKLALSATGVVFAANNLTSATYPMELSPVHLGSFSLCSSTVTCSHPYGFNIIHNGDSVGTVAGFFYNSTGTGVRVIGNTNGLASGITSDYLGNTAPAYFFFASYTHATDHLGVEVLPSGGTRIGTGVTTDPGSGKTAIIPVTTCTGWPTGALANLAGVPTFCP